MDEEIEVSTETEKKDETPVSFIESDGDTLVQVGGDKKTDGGKDDERWQRAETERLRLAADLADVRSRLAGSPSHQGPSNPGPNPWKGQEEAISEQERALGIQWEAHKAARSLTPELLKEFDQKSRDLQQSRINISTQRAMQSMLPQIIQANQRSQYAQEYGDVQNNPNANRWARGHYDQLIAQGAPDSPETVRQAMNAARHQFKLSGYRSAPTEQDRQQFTGFSGNNRRNMDPKNNVVKMGKSEKIMAMSMYGDRFNGDEKKAYAQWAKGPGIKAQKAMQKGRQSAR